MNTKKYLLDLSYAEMEKFAVDCGEKPFRAKQLLKWIYQKRLDYFSGFSDLSEGFREKLDKEFILRSLKLKTRKESAKDGTIRFDLETRDGHVISCVYLPRGGKNTACISTQIGCSVACEFCNSGRTKFVRNLSKGEMLEQVFQAEKQAGVKIDGVLFMGMGEPLLNFDNTVAAVKAMTDKSMMGIGRRHITVSTVGYVPLIHRFSAEKTGVRLAISLHASDNETRDKIIPKLSEYSVEKILDAGMEYAKFNKARLTVEYILIPNLTDTLQLAQKLVKLLRTRIGRFDEIQVNLIPFNPGGVSKFAPPSREFVERFREYLDSHGILAIVREAKGSDIGAACGQLGV